MGSSNEHLSTDYTVECSRRKLLGGVEEGPYPENEPSKTRAPCRSYYEPTFGSTVEADIATSRSQKSNQADLVLSS